MRRGNLLAGAILVSLLALASAAGPFALRARPTDLDFRNLRAAPSPSHPFGTDDLGRDVLARVLHGGRRSLALALSSVALALLLGVPLGAAAGAPGILAEALSRLVDLWLALPSILLAMLVLLAAGPGTAGVAVAIALANAPAVARQVRASVLEARARDFALASVALGASPLRLAVRVLLPFSLPPLLVVATLGLGTAILDAAGLHFLGLGAETGTPEWGRMIQESAGLYAAAPHAILFPGLAVASAVLGFNLLGDGLRDRLLGRPRGG